MNYEFDEKSMSSTKFFYGVPIISNDNEFCQPCKYEIPMKNKTLEVIENEFALKYPGPYKSFKDEQDRQLIEFIKTYTQNHEEI